MARTDNLNNFLTDVAAAIKDKLGVTDDILASEFDTKIESIPTGGGTGFTGNVDVTGLTAIGWDEEDIAYLQENVWWNEEDDAKWLVPQYDKDCWQDYLDGVFVLPTSFDSSNNMGLYYPLLTYCPKFAMSTSTGMSITMGSMFTNSFLLVSVPKLKTLDTYDCTYLFYNCYSLRCVPLFEIGGNASPSMLNMFNNCYSLTSVPELDTSDVTNVTNMFYDCSSLATVPQLDTSSVTTMRSMFNSCYSLQSIPELDTSSVTNMSNMFYSCYLLQTIPELDTSSVTNMSYMFNNCYLLQSIPELDTSSVTTMSNMFSSCRGLQTIPELDMASVTITTNMFNYCYSLQNCYLKNIGVSIVLSGSLYLSVESMVYIMEHAQTVSTGKLTFGSTNLAKLTDEQKAIAIDKGWTLA